MPFPTFQSEIMGIKEFASDRRNALTFATFDPTTASVKGPFINDVS